jgi:hypothetical protein
VSGQAHYKSMANVERNIAQDAFRIVEKATQSKHSEEIDILSQEQVRKFMREMGRRGGLKGGSARAASMNAQQRSESASKAARARWGKETGKD